MFPHLVDPVMPQAACMNSSCDRDTWILTKPLEEYAGDGPTCPDCGTTRVEVVPEYQQQGPPQQVQGQPQAQPAVPATGGGQIPERYQPVDGAESVAMEAAAAFDSHAPIGQRAESARSLANMVGGLVSGVMKAREFQEERARQYAESVDVRPVDGLPSCEQCGATLDNIHPNAAETRCPECGLLHEVIPR